MLPVVQDQLPHASDLKIVGVKVIDCKNGYARVAAISDGPLREQVFLKVADDRWVYLDSGSGPDCGSDPDSLLGPDLVQACTALELR
jgi:hypothetical protein